MRRLLVLLLLTPALAWSETQVTIYNQQFALVKERVALELTKGEQEVRMTDITAHLEPDSVVVRDVQQPDALTVLEQNYEPDPLNQGLMLREAEGQTITFENTVPATGEKIQVQGKILRSGYVPHLSALANYGAPYAMRQMNMAQPQGGGQPIVEVNGKILFGLPGTPLFDQLADDAVLKPTLLWRVQSSAAGRRQLEYSYLTGGLRWEASYNLVAPKTGNNYDLVGWITLENMSGKDFHQARVKLMAGDVNRAQGQDANGRAMAMVMRNRVDGGDNRPTVSERTFDDYHLYEVARPLEMRDREVKQVEFLRAAEIPATRFYVYDGAKISEQHRGWNEETIRRQREYGVECNPKVWTMLEFQNTEKNGLGLPLPKGRLKLYRHDQDQTLEFVGEDWMDHTARDEAIRLAIGNAFDLVGERKQTNYQQINNNEVRESFEITLRNHKTEPVEVRVVEHLYRWTNWEIENSSQDFAKTDARTIEYRVTVPPAGRAIINYTAHYSW